MKQARIHCPYCGSLAMLRPASAIHGLSDISAGTYLYVCRRWPACDAYVTADRRTKQPLGTLANGDLRHKRILAHHALHSVQAQLGMQCGSTVAAARSSRQCQTFTCGSKLCLILTDAITDKIEAEDSRCLK